jgi:hypothetical protein
VQTTFNAAVKIRGSKQFIKYVGISGKRKA